MILGKSSGIPAPDPQLWLFETNQKREVMDGRQRTKKAAAEIVAGIANNKAEIRRRIEAEWRKAHPGAEPDAWLLRRCGELAYQAHCHEEEGQVLRYALQVARERFYASTQQELPAHELLAEAEKRKAAEGTIQ
jgi:hypothetical protein